MRNEKTPTQSYMRYWGKTRKKSGATGADYHLLPYHCLDVAAVGMQLLSPDKAIIKDLAAFLELTPKKLKKIVVFFLSLHDLGKFASAFQRLYQNDTANLFHSTHCHTYNGRDYRHDRMGLFFWDQIKEDVLPTLLHINNFDKREQGTINKALMILANCVFGHHGKPVNTEAVNSIRQYTEPDNSESAALFVQHLFELIQPELPINKLRSKEWCRRLEQVSWHLAGLAVLADWIGSDSHYFHYQSEPMALEQYWLTAQETAATALAATDLNAFSGVKPYLSIKEHFGFDPTPLQQWAERVEIDDSPQLFILEDITGAGKTEAALALTHRLMQAGAAEGFYFGLPTMATSNAMFSRVASYYQQMLSAQNGKLPSIVLAHGAREMNELFRESILCSGATDLNYASDDITATAQCNQWLADSRKKALLAPVGVGTIDQALLAVLPRRHQSLRLLGLNRKVLIFDEVHAADEFMFELLESLLALHLHQGGSVLLLTATLPQKQRARLAAIWHRAGGLSPSPLRKTDFPLATKVSLNPAQPVLEQPLASRADVSREVKLSFLHRMDACVDTILSAIAKDQCVVWVRNSVDDALEAYQLIHAKLDHPENALLFHSRFILQDRKTIENRVLDIFGKHSNAEQRRGKVLIATQVFQESLDADADIMLSDICPIDDLIQRAGRLHRHTRNAEGIYQLNITDARPPPMLFVHAPEWQNCPTTDWLSAQFRNTQYVYRSPGRLWLAMRELMRLGAIQMPSKARVLIESVYSEEADQQIPQALLPQDDEFIGEARSKAAKAKSQLVEWNKFGYCDRSARFWYEDDTDISTRHSDIETVSVLLLKQNENGELIPWVDDVQFAVQLSTVTLSKYKYADKLAPIPDELEHALCRFKQRYPLAEYLQCWLPHKDQHFTYCSTLGVYENPH